MRDRRSGDPGTYGIMDSDKMEFFGPNEVTLADGSTIWVDGITITLPSMSFDQVDSWGVVTKFGDASTGRAEVTLGKEIQY